MTSQTVTVNDEAWRIDAPDEVSISQADGLLKIGINAQGGNDRITFTPVNNSVDGVFKTPVEFDVTNGTGAPLSGFDLKLVNNTPAMGPLDLHDPTGHPDNYAHVHNLTGADGTGDPFAPLSVSTFLPDGSPDPSGLAPVIEQSESPPSELSVSGNLDPGQMVSAKASSFHQTEVAGQDNGFQLLFSPTGSGDPAMALADFPMMSAMADMSMNGSSGAGAMPLMDVASMQNMLMWPTS